MKLLMKVKVKHFKKDNYDHIILKFFRIGRILTSGCPEKSISECYIMSTLLKQLNFHEGNSLEIWQQGDNMKLLIKVKVKHFKKERLRSHHILVRIR